jgi:hypothetical protein
MPIFNDFEVSSESTFATLLSSYLFILCLLLQKLCDFVFLDEASKQVSLLTKIAVK